MSYFFTKRCEQDALLGRNYSQVIKRPWRVCGERSFFRLVSGFAPMRGWQTGLRSFPARGEIRSTRFFQRDAFQKKNSRGAADRIGAGARDHSADNVAPAGEKL